MQRQSQLLGVIADDAQVIEADFVRWEHTGAVARVDTRFLDVLHDPGKHHSLAVSHRIDVHFKCVLDELVNQDRVALGNAGRLPEEMLEGYVVVGDGHRAPAQDK